MDFPVNLRRKIRMIKEKTKGNGRLRLNVALSYSGRAEIIRAVNMLIKDVKKGILRRVDESSFRRYLFTEEMPDPDLLIRTSGEMRISNFLLWQIAYSELYITETLWPDFRKEQYIKALKDFSRRERRFGKVRED
jgi:undecaprenyl diphosphate synthase